MNIAELYQMHYDGLTGADTFINGRSYYKLYSSSDTVMTEDDLVGALREDSFKRVYIRFFKFVFPDGGGGGGETLMFDFSLNAGDTARAWDNTYANNWGVDMPVASVDSVEISGTYRRRINFGGIGTSFYSWVEGIGDIKFGLLWHAGLIPTNGTSSSLVCFGQNGDWLFHNSNAPSGEDCLYHPLVGIRETGAIAPANIVFYPQPLTTVSKIYLSGIDKLNSMEVYDLSGRLLRSYKAGSDGTISLDRGDYSPGLYVYRLRSDKGEKGSGRFVAQ